LLKHKIIKFCECKLQRSCVGLQPLAYGQYLLNAYLFRFNVYLLNSVNTCLQVSINAASQRRIKSLLSEALTEKT